MKQPSESLHFSERYPYVARMYARLVANGYHYMALYVRRRAMCIEPYLAAARWG